LRSVGCKALTLERDRPAIIRISIGGQQITSFTGSTFDDGSRWSCPLAGVAVADAERVQFIVD